MRCLHTVLISLISLAGATLLSSPALGQVQVLDSVDAFGPTSGTTGTVLEMGFRDSYPRTNFEALDISASPIISCQRAVDQGLYCVVGTHVRYWPDTDDVRTAAGTDYIPYFNAIDCRDPALGLDTRKPNACTSVTTDIDGAIWIAGRKANSHSVFKVVQKAQLEKDGWTEGCSARGVWRPLTSPASQTSPALPDPVVPTYCAREYASGRPSLLDINQVDFEVAEHFITAGPAAAKYGIVGLERREDLTFFPDVGFGSLLSPVQIVSGKNGWGIGRGEELVSATILQFGPDSDKKNFALAVSNLGRVIAKKIGPDGVSVGSVYTVFNIPANRDDPRIDYSRCVDDSTQTYGIRVSSESDRVYVSDRNCGHILALEWVANGESEFPGSCDAGTPTDQPFCLANARERVTSTVWSDVTLSTVSTSTALSPAGLSVSPGIGLNLAEECGFNDDGTPKTCPFVGDGDGNGVNAAQLSGVTLEQNGAYGMTVYQVRGILDCRDDATAAKWPAVCNAVAVDSEGYMDIWSMLPPIVQDRVRENSSSAFDPQLLISPRYRGQLQGGQRTFDLFFGVTEPGVQFRETFSGQFDVGDLTGGGNLGCGGTPSTVNGGPDLAWDVVVTVSEKFKTVGGPGNAPANVDTLVNTGCFNPTQISGSRWSLYAYNMEVDPDFSSTVYPTGDAIYAGLLLQLFDQMQKTQDTFACSMTADPTAPLSQTTCDSLTAKWKQAKGFLDECIASSTSPRANQGVNNCNAFLSQIANYRDIADVAVRQGPDPANRIGELIVRAKVIEYVYQHHFVPSIPPNGFCDIAGATGCP